jgi:hypothetical protein
MSSSAWRRVSRDDRCPVCGKGDWCLVSTDGSAAICPRVESPKRVGESGFLHRLLTDTSAGPRSHIYHVRSTTAGPDLGPLAADCRAALDPGRLYRLARQLGVRETSLTVLGIGWSEEYAAFSFPMVDLGGQVVGIRLRRPDGRKLAVRGGRDGLFLPSTKSADQRLVITEGPTDTAAALTLGYAHVAGRPSCMGGVKFLCALVRQRPLADVVIIADADEPGRRGANALASRLVGYTPAVRVIVPRRYKDLRDFVQRGGTREQLEQVIATAPVRRLRVSAGRTGP